MVQVVYRHETFLKMVHKNLKLENRLLRKEEKIQANISKGPENSGPYTERSHHKRSEIHKAI